MTRIINIAGNSGAGKSIVTLNLGIAMSRQGRDVLVMDGNIYSPDLAHYSDINPISYLNEYLYGEKKIDEIMHSHSSGIRIIPSIQEDQHSPYLHEKINDAVLSLHGKAEIVLVDLFSHNPALFSAIHASDETVFITDSDYHSITKAANLIRKMESLGMNVNGVILNKTHKKNDISAAEAILDKKVLAEVPYDKKLIESINNRQPHLIANPNSIFSSKITEIANILDVWDKK